MPDTDFPDTDKGRPVSGTITYRQCGMMRRRLAVEGHCGRPEDDADWYAEWRAGRKLGA